MKIKFKFSANYSIKILFKYLKYSFILGVENMRFCLAVYYWQASEKYTRK